MTEVNNGPEGLGPRGARFNKWCMQEDVSPHHGRKLIAKGKIRAFRVGRTLYVDLESWREYVDRQQKEGVPRYENAARATEVRVARRKARKEVDLEDLGLLPEQEEVG